MSGPFFIVCQKRWEKTQPTKGRTTAKKTNELAHHGKAREMALDPLKIGFRGIRAVINGIGGSRVACHTGGRSPTGGSGGRSPTAWGACP